MDDVNYQHLAQQEINFLMHAHLPVFDESMLNNQDEKFV